MKNIIIALLALVLAGCITTPNEMREKGEKHEFTMQLAPSAAAACVARNLENSNGLNTSVRDGLKAGSVELLAYMNTTAGSSYIIVADFDQDQSGSIAKVLINPITIPKQSILKSFKGC